MKITSFFSEMILTAFLLGLMLHGCTKEDSPLSDVPPVEAGDQHLYYVSTSGNDNSNGTINKPFASWQKAFNTARPGDTVYIRGGRYSPDVSKACGVYIKNKSGDADNMIHVFAYPGERPILDASVLKNNSTNNYGIVLENSNYWHLRGLEVTGASQQKLDRFAAGIRLQDSNHNLLEQLKTYGNQGPGIYLYHASEDNLVLNCDSYNNYDPYTSSDGGNADGFEMGFITERNGNERINTFKGCRSWFNSDDGFDLWDNEGIVFIDSCWAFKNGRFDGNGNGFKMGKADGTPENTPQRLISNCLSFVNRQNGFDQSEANVLMEFSHNISYDNNKYGFYLCEFKTLNLKFVMNIAHKDGNSNCFPETATDINNSWDAGYAVDDNAFMSIDSTGVTGSRQQNGSLPVIDFLRLK
jgi:parallel beta-helix repeat protein